MDDCDIFRDQLATTYPRYGYALWNPSPTRSDRPVEVGDVGFIRWGTFHRLFNALLPAGDPSHEFGLPEGYKPLAPSLPNHINRGPFRCGQYCSKGICVGSVPDYQDGPDDLPKLAFLRPGKQKGAVLCLPVDARRENTIAQGDFSKWMIEHIDRLFNFARRLGLGIEQMEQIILVTGCDRATSWINVAFLGNHDDARVSFGVRIVDPDGPNMSTNFQFPPGNVQGAVLNYGPQGTDLLDNQCVFIRGFRVARTLRILPKHLKAAADSAPDPEGDGGESDNELVSIPAATQDPLKLLLGYVAEKATDCDMVLVHDDDLQEIVKIEGDTETSLDILQPDVMMDLFRRSNIDIHKFPCAVPTSTTSLNTDIVVGRVAKISATPQNPRDPSNVASKLSVPGYKMNQPVSARITTDTWVMGVIIGVAHIDSKVTGSAYVVEFETVDGRRERREFSDEELRPYPPLGLDTHVHERESCEKASAQAQDLPPHAGDRMVVAPGNKPPLPDDSHLQASSLRINIQSRHRGTTMGVPMVPPNRPTGPPGPPHGHSPPGPQQQLYFQYSQCTGRKRALCIGINYFGQRELLRACINDTRNVERFLCEEYGYMREDMMVLTDDQQDPHFIPTKDNMLRAMSWLVAGAQPEDSLFFHFSGHGGQTKDADGDEADGFDEVIYPVDFKKAGHIVDNQMHDIMVKPLPSGCRLTSIFDCCHSGSALDLPYIYCTEGKIREPNLALDASQGLVGAVSSYSRGDMGGVLRSVSGFVKTATAGRSAQERARQTKTSPADVISWSGCKDTETSADAVEADQVTGAMSYAFILALTRQPQQSYQQLLVNLQNIMRAKYSQKPQLSSSHPMDTSLKFIM